MQSSEALLEETFALRPSVPFEADNLFGAKKPAAAPTPKLNYPVFKPILRPAVSARIEAQQKIEQEISQADALRKNLDQLIQHSANLQQQAVQSLQREKPQYQQSRQLWWPKEAKKERPVTIKKAPMMIPKRVLQPIVPVQPLPKPIPIKVKVAPQRKPTPQHSVANLNGPELIDYLLPTITESENPFNDKKRQLVIYSLKSLGYLIFLATIFEIRRYLEIGLNLNGIFEILSIFTLSGIFLFFGANLNILSKPVNPYLVREVV